MGLIKQQEVANTIAAEQLRLMQEAARPTVVAERPTPAAAAAANARVAAINEVTRKMQQGEISPADALAQIEAIKSQR
jgi:hypothetical protein